MVLSHLKNPTNYQAKVAAATTEVGAICALKLELFYLFNLPK